jgi:hypothetical protein
VSERTQRERRGKVSNFSSQLTMKYCCEKSNYGRKSACRIKFGLVEGGRREANQKLFAEQEREKQ